MPLQQFPFPSLNLPKPPSDCGGCSGISRYNNQLPESNPCDFTGSRPIQSPSGNPYNIPTPQPGYPFQQPTPVSRTTMKPIGPSTIPPFVGQFIKEYLNPKDSKIPNSGNPAFPGMNPFGKPCPRYDNPTPQFPQPIRNPRPVNGLKKPPPNPCDFYNPSTWNNDNSIRQPLIIQCASGNMKCSPNPFQPQWHWPENPPPILQSGKRRDVRTPDEVCQPQGSGQPNGGQQYFIPQTPRGGQPTLWR